MFRTLYELNFIRVAAILNGFDLQFVEYVDVEPKGRKEDGFLITPAVTVLMVGITLIQGRTS